MNNKINVQITFKSKEHAEAFTEVIDDLLKEAKENNGDQFYGSTTATDYGYSTLKIFMEDVNEQIKEKLREE